MCWDMRLCSEPSSLCVCFYSYTILKLHDQNMLCFIDIMMGIFGTLDSK